MPRKHLAALAAVTAAAALVVPTASASTGTPRAPARSHAGHGASTPSTVVCSRLSQEIGPALQAGNPTLANALARTFVYMRCGGPV